MSRRLRLSAQEGSLLIEVMVGAIVLAIATTAILGGLEGAQSTGLKNRQRSASATLAQQDIERLRAFPITALSNYSETRTVSLQGAPYTVISRTDWVRDSNAEVNCTDDTPEAEYIKITSTAHPPNQPDRSVKEASLLTPAPGAFSDTAGTAAVKVTGRTGAAQAGVTVNLSGAGSASAATNSLGCAIFDFVPAGAYEVEVPGLVTWAGEPGASMTVAAGKSTLRHLEMERPASLRAVFELPPGAPAGTPAAGWSSITVSNSKLPGQTKAFTAASPVTSIDADGLFPFLDGYAVYAGTCSRNNPAVHQSNYFQVSGKGVAQLDPGELLETVPVQMGTLTVTVTNNTTGAPINNALVVVRQQDNNTGCNRDLLMGTGNTGATGVVTFVLPFGMYNVCASGLTGNVSSPVLRRRTSGTFPTVRPPSNMNQSLSISVRTSDSSGNCSTVTDTSP